ncbi:MAG: M28 family peptidase [Paludibacteraceae bacterium]
MRNLLLFSLIVIITSCTKTTKTNQSETVQTKHETVVNVPEFSADSAYWYVQQQVDFGPREPNTKGHSACADFLIGKLNSYGGEVVVQQADLKAFDGTILKAKNIIGSFNPEMETRVMLFAHWDTRPWSDHDSDPAHFDKPILGANDAASGVGILLEIARQFSIQKPEIGVDIILFDAEDYGAPEKFASAKTTDSWCLGSQYWSKNKHIPGYRAKYGILLDMVGGANSTFYREHFSDFYAKYVVDKVWEKASSLGFSHYFINEQGGAIQDDHVYVNQLGGIPAIDIIHQDRTTQTGFGTFWHTQGDNMDVIDKNTLHAVGTTLLHIVYSEKP